MTRPSSWLNRTNRASSIPFVSVGDEDSYNTEGVVEFTLDGQTLRLRPFTTRPKRFYFVFRDASSGQETSYQRISIFP